MDKMDLALKTYFFFSGVLLWAGIWLTGFEATHWLLYLPATFFLFAAITGICPGLIIFKEIFKEKQSQEAE